MKDNNQKAKRGIPQKSNFNEWYPFIVEAAELIDKRASNKGMDVWRSYGWKTKRLIDSHTHDEMERTGHGERNFPLVNSRRFIRKENKLVLLKRAREQGVDPEELRHEEDEAGFKKKSIGLNTRVKIN